MDLIEMYSNNPGKKTIDLDRLDFGQYDNHLEHRPYTTLVEGVNWYLNRHEISFLPETLILPMVAHNFGLSVDQAIHKINLEAVLEDVATTCGVVSFE